VNRKATGERNESFPSIFPQLGLAAYKKILSLHSQHLLSAIEKGQSERTTTTMMVKAGMRRRRETCDYKSQPQSTSTFMERIMKWKNSKPNGQRSKKKW